jgi:NAD(P)H-flavin reductase
MHLQELIVKHYKGGLFTEYLFGLKEGDKIAFKGASTCSSLRSRL